MVFLVALLEALSVSQDEYGNCRLHGDFRKSIRSRRSLRPNEPLRYGFSCLKYFCSGRVAVAQGMSLTFSHDRTVLFENLGIEEFYADFDKTI